MKKIITLILTALTFVGYAQDPTTSAGTPSQASTDVISIFSDSYTDVSGTDFYPNWGQSTQYAAFTLGSDNMIKYSNLNYQGIQFGSAQDASAKGYLHMDIWTATSFDLDIYCISQTPQAENKVVKTLAAGEWNSIDIDLAEYTSQGLSIASLYQFKFDDLARTGSTIFLDNVYFYTEADPAPMTSAPSPAPVQRDVVSIYSNAYSNVAGTDFFPNWGQSTQKEDFIIGTDTMIKYSNLNYQGIQFSAQDVTNMETLHMDIWSATSYDLDIYCISQTPQAENKVVKTLAAGEWNSIDIPLSDFTSQGLSVASLYQFKFDDLSRSGSTIFLDNVYFSKPDNGSVKETAFSNFEVYPNPAAEFVKLEAVATVGLVSSYTIQSINGQTVTSKELNSSVVSEVINTSSLEAGIYFLQVATEQGTYTHKLIIQ